MSSPPSFDTRLSAVFENTHALLALLDPSFNFMMVNSAYAKNSKRKPEELIGRNHFDLFPDPDNQTIFARVRDSGQAYYTIERSFSYPDQPERGVTWWNWSLVPIKSQRGDVEALLISLVEVTPSVLARQRIELLVQEMDAVFGAMTDGVILYDERGVIARVNAGAIATYGFDPTGLHFSELIEKTAMRLGDGESMSPDLMPAAQALAGEVVVNARFRFKGADARERTVLVSCSPLRSTGRITGAVAVWRDVTEREELLARAQAARSEAERAAELRERLMAIVSHDLRNPLSAISLTAKSLLMREHEAQCRAMVHLIETSAARMAAMIRDVLDYTGLRTGEMRVAPRPTDLCALAMEITSELQASNPGREIVAREEGDCTADVDPERVKQVLANLLANALQHGEPGTPVELTIGGQEGRVSISVHNHGRPIPASDLPRLFEPFRRGRGGSSGLGLGLYIVREIVRAHDGDVSVHSTAEDGTRFTVSLPRRLRDRLPG